jgi:hypothetical protein
MIFLLKVRSNAHVSFESTVRMSVFSQTFDVRGFANCGREAAGSR